jgi:threonine/homoserine/homoserine lactone efflux protein
MNTRRRPKAPSFRAGLDYFMAIAMLLFGCFIIFSKQMTGEDFFKDSQLVQGGMKWVIGILFMLYGAFRGYRGYLATKNAQEDDN